MKIIKILIEHIVLTIGFIIIVLPQMIYFSIVEFKDLIIDKIIGKGG